MNPKLKQTPRFVLARTEPSCLVCVEGREHSSVLESLNDPRQLALTTGKVVRDALSRCAGLDVWNGNQPHTGDVRGEAASLVDSRLALNDRRLGVDGHLERLGMTVREDEVKVSHLLSALPVVPPTDLAG